jgi:serine/threonine protein kinase
LSPAPTPSPPHLLFPNIVAHTSDLAARNVLMDSANTCKISDFGMSAALTGDHSSDYASNYVKLRGELPVRWSAIEVLSTGKYSRASDVWAFGVLVYEVMSRGQQPYNEFATLAEVAERIKSGYAMPCPEGCPAPVHSRVMAACWRADPKKRPGFGKLSDILQDLGAVPTDAETAAKQEHHVVQRQGSFDETKEQWKESFNDRRSLGVSVHHLAK